MERVSLPLYEGAADDLGMPYSKERSAIVSITYNRNAHLVRTRMEGFMDAVRDDDRAEAWYQLRYNAWGTNEAAERGLRKRRGMEAQIFGLYDNPLDISADDAKSVYRMFEIHKEDILRSEERWATSIDGVVSRNDIIGIANRDYADLTRQYGRVPTISSALEPARARLLEELRTEHPDLADRLRNEDFATTAIHLDPGRELRAGNNLRRDQRNNTQQDIDPNHAATIDSRRVQRGTEVVSNDLLIGEGGDDTLRAHRGDDILIGGQGRDRMEGGEGRDTYVIGAGDTLLDSDGLGEVRRDGQVLTGGARIDSDPPDTWRSADGRYSYSMAGPHLHIVDAQAADAAQREPVVIENFRNGQLGITLSGPHGLARIGEVPQPITAPQPDAAAAPALAQPQSDTRSFSTGDPDLDRLAAALNADDDAAISQAAAQIARSETVQAFERWGHELLAWEQQQERQQALDRQAQERQQQDSFSR